MISFIHFDGYLDSHRTLLHLHLGHRHGHNLLPAQGQLYPVNSLCVGSLE